MPFYIRLMCANTKQVPTKLIKSTPKNFDFLEVSGTYEQIGFQVGKLFGSNIRKIIQRRSEWHSRLMTILSTKKGRLVSKELLTITQKYFPYILQEIKGMADGAGISFDHLWAMSIKSELLALEKEVPGCSSIFFRDKDNIWLFHNEDGNNAYADIIESMLALEKPVLATGGGGYNIDNTVRSWSLAWSIFCGEDSEDLSAGLGGVMLENTDWAGGLRDCALLSDAGQRSAVDEEVERVIHSIQETLFPLHGL